MNLTVLGAGAWGTALAASVCERHPTRLWARDAAQAVQMGETRINAPYLPGVALPAALAVDADFDGAVAHARTGLVIIATPMAALDEMLRRVGTKASGVLWLCKGFEQRSGLLGHELARAAEPGVRVGVLSGPSFAIEVARAQPTALVAASADATLCAEAVEALHSENLRIYTSDDPVGVEVGGAVKNVLAIVAGIVDGRALGASAHAALVTRGFAELRRFSEAQGARTDTLMGLSGLGDLLLTCGSAQSRNMSLGRALGQGKALGEVLGSRRSVAEGVYTAAAVVRRANELGIDMPIAGAVLAIVDGKLTVDAAIEALLSRPLKSEA